ncbi:MAG: HD-GYP domain-containing protein [Candidatus Eremiobacteraeota bacterium]|nr:HD-GYP domain-containing protein [Candidatus Eremiobacteraeota bacterium]
MLERRREGFSALRHGRNTLANEILYHDASAVRNVAAHLFIDAFIDRVSVAAEENDICALDAWLNDVMDVGNPLSPPPEIVKSAASVIEAADGHPGVRRIARCVQRAAAAFEEAARRESLSRVSTVDAVDAAINRFMNALDRYDPCTAEHSRAVASWCARMGRQMGFSEPQCVEFSRAGLLHDVGKVRVPLEILDAPRALNDEEWKTMRAHVEYGSEIIVQDELLSSFLPAVRYHHERLDGTGYPENLSGEAIPFVARLVTVADSFNAMIGRRPYRPPILPTTALCELTRCAGSHFDPDIVRAMEHVVASGGLKP